MINHPNRRRKPALAAATSASIAVAGTPSAKAFVKKTRTPRPTQPKHDHDYDYRCLMTCVEQSRLRASEISGGNLFATDATGLWDMYLALLPAERQIHTCHACRRFVEHYGGLVGIATDGSQVPAMWTGTDWPTFYAPMIAALHDRVKRARVTGPYFDPAGVWGTPKTGPWEHLSVAVGTAHAYQHPLLAAHQAMAAKRQDCETVQTTLAAFSEPVLTQALRLLETESLRSGEKFVGPVRWLRDLKLAVSKAHGDYRGLDNLVWRAVASAPDGYCHTRASVVGGLLQDIKDKMPAPVIINRFNEKVSPLEYQRPKAAPTAGNIASAEKIVEALGIKRSLPRRYARLEDLETIWLPRPAKRNDSADAAAMAFAHLTPKGQPETSESLRTQPTTITWVKFAATVLPRATALQLDVPVHGAFIAFTTAVDPDAPPIMKWDRPERRNPVAWYVYARGSAATQWRLIPGWRKVNAVSLLPTMWGDNPMPFLGEGAVFILDGAADMQNTSGGLFPQCLRGELHEVRATIEAYSQSATLADADGATACGYDLRKEQNQRGAAVRALIDNIWTNYQIDRWD